MKTQAENTRNEPLLESVLFNAKNSRKNAELRTIDSLASVSREDRKKAASKPLYLIRYE